MAAVVAAALIASLGASPARAWEGIDAVWSEQPVPYWIDADLAPFDDAEARLAIHNAFDTWASVPCTSLRFTYAGRTPEAIAVDARNTVSLVASGWPEPGSPGSLVALRVQDGTILEGDVALDLEGADWRTRGGDGASILDLRAGLVAAVGRMIGLTDSAVQGATLNPDIFGHPAGRALSDDDIEGVCALYPATQGGEGGIGEPCANDGDCAGGNSCVIDASGAYCAPSCPTANACPAGYTCLSFANRKVCARGGCGCAVGRAACVRPRGVLGDRFDRAAATARDSRTNGAPDKTVGPTRTDEGELWKPCC